MSRARILILTNGHLCRNPRVAKEAATLGGAGHDVTVLNVHNHPASVRLDAEIAGSAPYRVKSVNMLRGAGAAAFIRRAAVAARRHATRRLGVQTLESLGPASTLLRRARELPADLTIVHNEVAHGVGLRLQRAGRRVAADIEDWHSEDLLPADRRHRPLDLLRAQEKALLHAMAYTSTTSAALADALHARYGGRRPHVIANSFPLQPAPRPTQGTSADVPAFFWFSQTIGPGRGLEDFLRAWTLTRERSRVLLLGEVANDYRQALLSLVPADRRAAVTTHACMPPAALPAFIAQHDIGLALEDRSILNRDLTITNKILQYLNAGLAVVASDTAGQREVLARSPEAGVILPAEAPRAATQLDLLLRDRDRLARRQQAARALAAEHYCWEREAPRLLALVANALGGPPTKA